MGADVEIPDKLIGCRIFAWSAGLAKTVQPVESITIAMVVFK